MKKVKDSRKRWKQLVTMLLVTAVLVTGTPDIVGLASEGTQEQVTTAADQAEGQAEAAQEEEAISEEPVEQQDTSAQQDTAAKQENTEKNIENRSTAGTTERSENSQNSHEKDKAASGAKSGGSSTSKVRETEKNTKDKDTKTEYTYRGSAIQAKVTLKDAKDLSDEADLRVKQTTVANKIKTQIINKAVGEENTQLVESVKAYDLSFILNGESVTPSGSMQVTLANLGTKSGQNTLIYQVTDDGQVKNTDAVRTGSDAMQFVAKSLCTYVVLTYTTVSDVNGNDITTLYPAMVTAAQTQLESKEDGNVPVESWTRTNTPLVLKDTTGKKALAWTWSDIAGIDLSLDNDSQIWNGSRSYGKHTSTSLKNGRVTAKSGKLYDSALWKNEGKAGKDTTITRIRGEFTITDKNKNNYAYTLKPVTDSENIYAKDNMFVFVYPKDVELTDDNYMDYLAFWTGSLADAGEKERTFHGRTASNYTQRTPVENVSVLTDGWHMTAACNNAGSIITSTDASDYYVDVISTTDSSNGGMYRFKLVKEKKEKTQFTFRNLDTNAKTGKGGAVFELYKDGVHYSAQSENEEGRVTFNIVKPEGSDTDVYTLKETKAPEGYDKITTTWKVLVSSEGVTMVKDTEGNEMPKYPDGTYVVSSAKTDEADSTEQTAKTSSVIREYKSDGQTPIANNIIVNQTPKEIIQSSMDYSKTAKVNNWDQRTYDITINASSKVSSTTITTKKPVVDIMLVLDVSGSMGENIETYDYVAENTSDGRGSLDKDKTYYLEVDGEYKKMSYSWRYGKRDWYVGNTKASEYSKEYKIYERKNITKLAALKNSVYQFIDDTKTNSPNSKIGITAFSSSGYGDHGKSKELMQVGVGDNANTLKSFVNNLNAKGGTDPAVGLNKAKTELVNANDENPKYVILFTDGKPTGGGSEWNTTAQTSAETSANELKDAGYTVYTIGFDLDEKSKTFLAGGTYSGKTYPGIASKGCAKEANDAASLNAIFKEIQSEVTNNSDITGATITDVIDPRFVVVNDNDNDGTVITNEDLKDGPITLKNGGVVSLDENGNQVVTWTDQTIPNKNKDGNKKWSNTITVKAKDDFIGGNKIITNGSESGITLENVGTVHFEQPAVNVKLLDITQDNKEITVFLGDEIDPANLLEQLNEEQPKINGFEKDSNGASKNTYNIPESSCLTADEISKLLNAEQTNDKQPSISKPYSYGNTQDNVGEFVYTIEVVRGEKTSHNTTTAGVQVEQYKLQVEYVPYTMNERETNKAPGTLSTAPGTELSETDKKTSDNYYYVNVVAGKIQLIKKLDRKTPAPDNDKTFNFNVEYTAPGGTASELKQINLTVDKVTKISGEEMVVYGTSNSQQLPRGTYVIKESLNPEYKLKNIENSITSTISTSEGSQSVTKTTNCYNEISNPIADDSSITFTIGTNTEGNVIGKDENRNVTGLNETEIEKTTSKEGVVTAIKATKAAEGYATFTNEARLSSIHIKKVDADGKTSLEGAMFTLKKKGTEKELSKITTDKEGEADFKDIAPGTYQITEVQSPKGYTLLANPIEVTLPYTASSTDVSTTDTPIKIGDTSYYYNITYTIKNNKLFNMPASGGRFKATLIGIAVMIMAAGCYILRHRRKRII